RDGQAVRHAPRWRGLVRGHRRPRGHVRIQPRRRMTMSIRTRILLVDDSEAELELMRHYLDPWPTPLHVDCAENGRQAVDHVAAHAGSLALVIIDYKMP